MPSRYADIRRVLTRASLTAGLLPLAFVACSSGAEMDPVSGTGSIRFVNGAGVTDTIEAQQMQPLVVEVRDHSGRPVAGTAVRFEPIAVSDTSRANEPYMYLCAAGSSICEEWLSSRAIIAATDAAGQAMIAIRMGRRSGRAVVKVQATDVGILDSALFTVAPGAPVRMRLSSPDTGLVFGASATIVGKLVDRWENTRSEIPTLSASAGNAIAFNAETGLATALVLGMQWVYAQSGTFVDSISVRAVPVGRLVGNTRAGQVRLVNLDGSNVRTIVTGVVSALNVGPHFGATRQTVTMQSARTGGDVVNAIVVDTTGSPRRDIDASVGLNSILAVRQLVDGTVLVLAQRTPIQGYTLWRVGADNSLTALVNLPGLVSTPSGADISHDGKRIAYVVAAAPSGAPELRSISVATGVVTIIEPIVGFPAWSPTDEQIAYHSQNGLAIRNADGSGRRIVTPLSIGGPVAWSPDGAYLVGLLDFNGIPALRLVRMSDGANVPLRFRTAGTPDAYLQVDWR